MQRVSADGLMCSAFAERAKCRLSARCVNALKSSGEMVMLRFAQFRVPKIGVSATLDRPGSGAIPSRRLPEWAARTSERIAMARQNYFNTLTMAGKLEQLAKCRFMERSEFNGVEKLRGKKVVIVGCGAQGLNQGLNMRDSGLDVSYALRADAIEQKRISWKNATDNGFTVGR